MELRWWNFRTNEPPARLNAVQELVGAIWDLAWPAQRRWMGDCGPEQGRSCGSSVVRKGKNCFYTWPGVQARTDACHGYNAAGRHGGGVR
jgi:hypothetical protein